MEGLPSAVDWLKRFLDHSVSERTWAIYVSAWRSFEAWPDDPTDKEGVRPILKGIARALDRI